VNPDDRRALGDLLVAAGWEPADRGWYSPHRAWHVDIDLATDTQLVLSRRGGWSQTLVAADLDQAVALLRAYGALPPQRCARCAGAERDSWPGRLVQGSAVYDRVDTVEPLPPDVDGEPLGRWAR